MSVSSPIPVAPILRSKRRWLRISLRTVLGVLTACCLLLGLWVAPAERQKRAVKGIEAAGGGCEYRPFDQAWFSKPDEYFYRDQHEPFRRLRRWLGQDYVDTVEGVSLTALGADDCLLRHVSQLPHVRQLQLGDSDVTDVGLGALKYLPELSNLYLWNTRISGTGLAHLPRNSKLHRLYLDESTVTDSVFDQLARCSKLDMLELRKTMVTGRGLELLDCPALTSLNLNETRVDDEALPGLVHLGKLDRLKLSHTKVTDAGLQSLGQLPELYHLNVSYTNIKGPGIEYLTQLSLRTLDLAHTQIDDEGLSHFSNLRGPYGLSLDHTPITDAGLVHLARLKNLTILFLNGTSIGDPGIETLVAADSPITHLWVSGTQVTDEGLLQIARLPKLHVVDVSNTAVTAEGIEQFKSLAPLVVVQQAWTEYDGTIEYMCKSPD